MAKFFDYFPCSSMQFYDIGETLKKPRLENRDISYGVSSNFNNRNAHLKKQLF
jgi:hypothetical protein